MDEQPVGTCPTMLKRAVGLGFLGGVLVAELYLLTLVVLTSSGSDWRIWPLLAWLAALIGGLAGMADGVFSLLVLGLAGRPIRRHMPLASLVGGLAAAAVPALVMHQSISLAWLVPFGGWLPAAAFLVGSVLTWPMLTGRPCLRRAGLRQGR